MCEESRVGGDSKALLIGIGIVGLVAVFGFGSCTTLYVGEQIAMREMVKNGADPRDARCAFIASGSSDPTCVTRAAVK
jgi:hypothetical protein